MTEDTPLNAEAGELRNEAAEVRTETPPSEWSIGIEPAHRVDVRPIADAVESIQSELGKVIVGQHETIELLIAGILIGGHVLLEGLPGIAKTLTAKLLARSVDTRFSRIQFTPDLMPTDVTGSSVFDLKDNAFHFRRGPIFSNIILIDEINRAPAKTQAALMEVMEEKQLTYDGQTYAMEFPFFVIATQNPVEQEGTYSLPEAQLDRFIFRIRMNYPDLAGEQAILHRFSNDFDTRRSHDVKPVVNPQELARMKSLIEQVYIRPELLNYIAAVVHNTRNNGDLFMGASPRASLSIMKASKAMAAIRGREFVTPDDIRAVAVSVLNHRIILSHEREMEGHTVEEIISDILQKVEVPR
ncbi:MAG: AAA family ATPase [Flavobacteriales bacterium]|jgi:MoxR-like ATPase